MDTNNYNYYEEEEEISLVDLIAYVFRHLKKMLIVSIVVALVVGGLLGYKKSRNNAVNNDSDTFLVSNDLIDINVYYSDEEVANSILNDLEGKLLSYNNELSSSIGTNKLTLVSENVYKGFNNNVVSVQKDKIYYINGLVTSITDIQKQLNSLYTSESTNNVSFKKVFVKYGVIGFVGMSFAMCVYYALAFIFSDKVYSANEFKDKTKIKVVGNLSFS